MEDKPTVTTVFYSADIAVPAREQVKKGSIVVYGPEHTQVVDFMSPTTTISVGRSDDTTVRVDDPSVSRMHAVFGWDGRELTVTDMRSHNGTRVGGQPVQRAVLKSGDEVWLGETRAVVAMLSL